MFTRQYLHDELWRLRDAFGSDAFWDKPGAAEIANKAIYHVFLNTPDATDFDRLRVEATLEELKRRWQLIVLLDKRPGTMKTTIGN